MSTYNPMFAKLKELQKNTLDKPTPAQAAPTPANTAATPTVQPSRPQPQNNASNSQQTQRPPAPQNQGGVRPPFTASGLPEGYLQGGYFSSKSNIKRELLIEHAEAIARSIGQQPGGIANAQLRKFYGHVRTAEERLLAGVEFDKVQTSVWDLAGFAAEARGKNKVPQVFKDFIDQNLIYVKTEADFRQGFVKHFQAVVAFFSYIHPRN